MAELTNLTDRISHLRDRKGSSIVPSGSDGQAPRPKKQASQKSPERRFASDYFMFFVYALLGVALVIQLGLILWLDVV